LVFGTWVTKVLRRRAPVNCTARNQYIGFKALKALFLLWGHTNNSCTRIMKRMLWYITQDSGLGTHTSINSEWQTWNFIRHSHIHKHKRFTCVAMAIKWRDSHAPCRPTAPFIANWQSLIQAIRRAASKWIANELQLLSCKSLRWVWYSDDDDDDDDGIVEYEDGVTQLPALLLMNAN